MIEPENDSERVQTFGIQTWLQEQGFSHILITKNFQK